MAVPVETMGHYTPSEELARYRIIHNLLCLPQSRNSLKSHSFLVNLHIIKETDPMDKILKVNRTSDYSGYPVVQ